MLVPTCAASRTCAILCPRSAKYHHSRRGVYPGAMAWLNLTPAFPVEDAPCCRCRTPPARGYTILISLILPLVELASGNTHMLASARVTMDTSTNLNIKTNLRPVSAHVGRLLLLPLAPLAPLHVAFLDELRQRPFVVRKRSSSFLCHYHD